jgi:hypothetical protein
MKTRIVWEMAFGVAVALAFAGSSHAQHAAGRTGAPVVSARPTSSVGMRPGAAARPGARPNRPVAHANDIGTGVNNSGNFGNFGIGATGGINQNLQNILNQVPGEGFDFEHLAAINADLGEKALIDPVTQGELALALRLLPLTNSGVGYVPWIGGGGYYPASYYSGEPEPDQGQAPAPQQPQVIVVQAQPAQQQQTAASDQDNQAPLPDVGDFTLVLRNGKTISAVAFTRQGSKLVYITDEGGRQTVAISDVDKDATQKVNEEHGTPLPLSL